MNKKRNIITLISKTYIYIKDIKKKKITYKH